MDQAYIRNRITQLRMKRGVSEYQMSLELGQNKSYVQAITSGRAMPSMAQFLNICDYFEITPKQFFDEDCHCPEQVRRMIDEMSALSEPDLLLVQRLIHRLREK